ncbi:hypothetical protein ACFL96_13095 [Thermoproteota archaeon]
MRPLEPIGDTLTHPFASIAYTSHGDQHVQLHKPDSTDAKPVKKLSNFNSDILKAVAQIFIGNFAEGIRQYIEILEDYPKIWASEQTEETSDQRAIKEYTSKIAEEFSIIIYKELENPDSLSRKPHIENFFFKNKIPRELFDPIYTYLLENKTLHDIFSFFSKVQDMYTRFYYFHTLSSQISAYISGYNELKTLNSVQKKRLKSLKTLLQTIIDTETRDIQLIQLQFKNKNAFETALRIAGFIGTFETKLDYLTDIRSASCRSRHILPPCDALEIEAKFTAEIETVLECEMSRSQKPQEFRDLMKNIQKQIAHTPEQLHFLAKLLIKIRTIIVMKIKQKEKAEEKAEEEAKAKAETKADVKAEAKKHTFSDADKLMLAELKGDMIILEKYIKETLKHCLESEREKTKQKTSSPARSNNRLRDLNHAFFSAKHLSAKQTRWPLVLEIFYLVQAHFESKDRDSMPKEQEPDSKLTLEPFKVQLQDLIRSAIQTAKKIDDFAFANRMIDEAPIEESKKEPLHEEYNTRFHLLASSFI